MSKCVQLLQWDWLIIKNCSYYAPDELPNKKIKGDLLQWTIATETLWNLWFRAIISVIVIGGSYFTS